MSGINFNFLVESLLFEGQFDSQITSILSDKPNTPAPTPQDPNFKWFYDLIDLHASTFSNIPIEPAKIEKCFGQVLLTYNAAPKAGILEPCLPLERIYDVLFIVNQQAKAARLPQPTSKYDLVNNGATFGNTIVQDIQQKISANKGWSLRDSNVQRAYDKLMDEIDLAAKAAIQSYYNRSILDAVEEMVKKRTDFFAKLMSFRNPFTSGFAKLIEDALLNPEQYISGNKEVTQDFKTIVDDLYFKNIIQVGLTAKKLYEVITNQKPVNITDYKNMLINKIPNSDYTIEAIDNMGTSESLAVITALKNIAEYQRSKAGRPNINQMLSGALKGLEDIGSALERF